MNNANIIAKIQQKIGKAYVDYIPLHQIDKEYLKTLKYEDDIEVYLLTGIKNDEYEIEEIEENDPEETNNHKMMYGYESPTAHRWYQ